MVENNTKDNSENRKRIIVAITGASGAAYGVKILEILKGLNIETHLILSKSSHITIKEELDLSPNDLHEMADVFYNANDIASFISSGSYKTEGMIIAPCSMKTLAEIANGISGNLVSRAADVVLKEKRKLVLMVRETPLTSIHLRNMAVLSDMGAYICPPVPAFYNEPKTIDDIVTYSVARSLDCFGLDIKSIKRWEDVKK